MSTLHRLVGVLLGANVAVAAIGSLFYPFGRDHGIFAWVGDVIVGGGAPYVDAWEQKGPATHYTYALVQLLFGRAMWGVRLFELILLFAALVALWRVVRPRTSNGAAAGLAMVLLASFHLRLGFWNTAQPDGWGAMLSVVALAVLVHEGKRLRLRRVLAGALIGLAALYKPTFLAMLAPLVVHELWLESETRKLPRVALILAGCFGLVGCAVSALAAQGALGSLVEIQFGFNLQVHQVARVGGVAGRLRELASGILGPAMLAPLLLCVALAPWLRRNHRALAGALATMFGVALVLLIVQNKFYAYHFAPLFAPVAIGAGLSMEEAMNRVTAWVEQRTTAAWIPALLAPVALLVLVFPARPPWNVPGWNAYVFGTMTTSEYESGFASDNFSFATNRAVGNYLREHSTSGDAIAVWAFEPTIAYLAERASATRFGFHYPLIVEGDPTLRTTYREEFVAAVRTGFPELIVVGQDDANSLMPRSSDEELQAFPEFAEVLSQHYAQETTVANFEVWRRAP